MHKTPAQNLPKTAQNRPRPRTHTHPYEIKGVVQCVLCANGSEQPWSLEKWQRTEGTPWTNLTIYVPFKSKLRDKLNYRLGWNGQRLALGNEVQRLHQWYPDVLESVTQWLEEGNLDAA